MNKKLINYLVLILSALFAVSVAEPLCFSNYVSGQASAPYGSVRLSIISGGNVPFVINSLEKWENGATLPTWTRLRISVTDSATLPTLTDWSVTFYAEDADADGLLTGEAGNTILFSTIELTSALVLPSCGAVLAAPINALSTAETPLVTGSIPFEANCSDDILEVTYDCGSSLLAPNSLMNDQNAAADYYSDIIIFTLYGCAGLPCP